VNPRIITGKYKGLKLEVSDNVRPLTDRVKKTIFDILGDFVEDSVVLDIFAGSGNFGIEALSRGAAKVVFGDRSKESINILNTNLHKAGIEAERYEVKLGDFRGFLDTNNTKFDLVFIDPPFEITHLVRLKKFIPSLKPGGVVVIKIPVTFMDKFTIPTEFELIREKKIGINFVYFLRLKN
jgi:16S rRNA (guanine966-N2)-methyltransferase